MFSIRKVGCSMKWCCSMACSAAGNRDRHFTGSGSLAMGSGSLLVPNSFQPWSKYCLARLCVVCLSVRLVWLSACALLCSVGVSHLFS